MDHYTVLGVPQDAPLSALASAYRARSLQLHPDKVASNASLTAQEKRERGEQFMQLQQAYHVLTQADTRHQYDIALKGQADGGPHRGAKCQAEQPSVALSFTCLTLVSFVRLLLPPASSSGGLLSCAEVDLDDCAYDESGVYSYPCRCGAEYDIDECMLESGIDLFPCAQCSLVVRIMFEWVQPTDDDAHHQQTDETHARPDTHAIRLDEME